MPEQVLQIEPALELKFKGPFNVPTTSLLKLSNPSDKRVCFKIKTTAPKRYCVRPNAGILEPGNSISIAVVFQPCELEPSANKHKFMVQSLFAPDDVVNMDALWKDVDATKLMDTKLRCAFEVPADPTNQNDLNSVQEEKMVKEEDGYKSYSTRSKAGSEESRGTGDGSQQLQQLAIQFKQENSQLKDELEKLRRQLRQKEASGGGSMMQMGTNASPPAIPMAYVVLAIVAALVGLIAGKFVL